MTRFRTIILALAAMLASLSSPARADDGTVRTIAGWPADRTGVAA